MPARIAAWQLGIAGAAFALCAVLASDQSYVIGETAVVERVNDAPRWVGLPLEVVMQVGTPIPFLVLALVIIIGTQRDVIAPLIAAALALLVAMNLDDVWKDVIERPRPTAVIDGLELRDDITSFGFPSGHTTMAFALAGVLHPLLPRWARVVAWTIAILVGVARTYVAAHWPLDIVGGAALGLAIAAASWLAAGHLKRLL